MTDNKHHARVILHMCTASGFRTLSPGGGVQEPRGRGAAEQCTAGGVAYRLPRRFRNPRAAAGEAAQLRVQLQETERDGDELVTYCQYFFFFLTH